MKGGVRIAAITTGPIGKGSGRKSGSRALLVCVVGTLNGVEGVLSTNVTIDGDDATRKITVMIKKSRFGEQVKAIAFNGIALAGLNIVDISELDRSLSAKSMIITRHKPRPSLLMNALRALKRETNMVIGGRAELLRSQKKSAHINGFYVQSGMDRWDTARILMTAASLLRLSHLISSGVSRGESKGRM